MAKHTIYKLYAELDDYKPKMWRVFEIDSKITLAKLGYILMTLFEMKAEHLLAYKMIPYELVEVRAEFKTKGDGYEEYTEWLGTDDLDLTVFDKDDINSDSRSYQEYLVIFMSMIANRQEHR